MASSLKCDKIVYYLSSPFTLKREAGGGDEGKIVQSLRLGGVRTVRKEQREEDKQGFTSTRNLRPRNLLNHPPPSPHPPPLPQAKEWLEGEGIKVEDWRVR